METNVKCVLKSDILIEVYTEVGTFPRDISIPMTQQLCCSSSIYYYDHQLASLIGNKVWHSSLSGMTHV